MSGWDAHCESVKVAAGNTYIESTIFNAQGDTFTAPHALYLKDLTVSLYLIFRFSIFLQVLFFLS